MKDKPETLIQPTMGIKWNSGSLLHMEAHMPSATQNNSKRTKRNNQERRNMQIPGIPMVMMVTSRAHSLCNPTQQDFINTHTLPIYRCHTRFKF